MSYTKEKQVAVQAATAAAQLCQKVRQEYKFDAIAKPDQSPVTIADFGAQAVICQALQHAFPQDPIVGEEDAALLQRPDMANQLAQVTTTVQSILPKATAAQIIDWINRGQGRPDKRFWVLDPIDGTKGYVRGDQYAIAIALIENGDVKVGVMACPALAVDCDQPDVNRGVLFAGVRGHGATLQSLATGQEQPIRVNRIIPGNAYRLIESVETDHGNPTLQRAIAVAVGITAPIIPMDSQAKYGAVARGEADLYLRLSASETPDYRENIWDHAPGVIILEEAGGQVTDMNGQPLDFSRGKKLLSNQGIIASNSLLHDAVLSVLPHLQSPLKAPKLLH